jgi:hypothetical protein
MAILSRPTEGDLLISAQSTPGALQCTSSYLRHSDLVEVRTTDPLTSLLKCDTVLIIVDPIRLTTPIQFLPSLSNAVVIVNGQSSQTTAAICVQAKLALEALRSLATAMEDPRSRTAALDKYQQQYLASNISAIVASEHGQNPTVSLTLDYIHATLDSDRTTTRSVARTISDLRRTATQAASRAKHLSVVAKGISGGVVEGSVTHEIDLDRRTLQGHFRSLPWLRLLTGRGDDVAAEIGSFNIARGLEQRVSFG